jgi:membrane-bound lytic murein transglycosylase D
MERSKQGGSAGIPVLVAGVPLIAIALLAGCAATAPVATSPAAAPGSSISSVPAPAPGPAPATEAEAQKTNDEARETSAEPTAATPEDEPQPAEEVEPSPLDTLPETAPEISKSELEQDKSIAAGQLASFDIPMVLNNQVMAYVDYFTHAHKELFAAGLERSGMYVELFRAIFEQAGIPKDLVYMAHVESAFKTNAYSRAKAKGIFQFISETGRRYGLRIDQWIDERSEPEKSARAAAAYLKDLHEMFGDWYLALAAYNAGEGKVQRAMAKTKRDDFWALASTRSLRSETKGYVPAILAATLIAKQPEKYGFEIQAQSPLAKDTVKIDGQTDLRILAHLADIDPETLKQMNPHLRRGMTPPGCTTDVHVPAGKGHDVAAAYANLPTADRMVIARHQVAKGESLTAIAQRYGVTSSAITSANHLGKSAAIKPGQELVIPAVAPAGTTDGFRGRSAVTYRVRKGDTLSEIAREYRTTPAAIASASGIGVHSPLRVGQRLTVPAKASSAKAGASATAAGEAKAAVTSLVHTVRPGETLYRIADKYQVTVDQICALNRITPNGVLYPGTRLTIRSN